MIVSNPLSTAATVAELRHRLGRHAVVSSSSSPAEVLAIGPSEICYRPGSITEWLVDGPGSGAATLAAWLWQRTLRRVSTCAMIDISREFYAAAFAGWGIDPSHLLLIRPQQRQEAWWAVEQCLRCRAVAGTWVWTDKVDERTLRRWQLAAETGGGVGMIFRPLRARHEPAWADVRLAVTPEVGTPGDSRRVRVETLYRRGGLGGSVQVWEIDHAAGVVRLVPSLADSTAPRRRAGA